MTKPKNYPGFKGHRFPPEPADNAFTGYIANMMFDLEFMLIENGYKTEKTHQRQLPVNAASCKYR